MAPQHGALSAALRTRSFNTVIERSHRCARRSQSPASAGTPPAAGDGRLHAVEHRRRVGGRDRRRWTLWDLRPLFLPADPCKRTDYRPGELAQWDLWFPATKIPPGQAQEAICRSSSGCRATRATCGPHAPVQGGPRHPPRPPGRSRRRSARASTTTRPLWDSTRDFFKQEGMCAHIFAEQCFSRDAFAGTQPAGASCRQACDPRAGRDEGAARRLPLRSFPTSCRC